jgi:hypothetical protein
MIISRFEFVAFVLILSGCGTSETPAQRCTSSSLAKAVKPALRSNWMEQRSENQRCAEGWAFKLAAAPGANLDIGKAAAQACFTGIEYEAALLAERDFDEGIRRGEQVKIEKALSAFYLDEALLNVVRARAGQCDDN